MDFTRARTQEQIEYRQMDILSACDILFEQYGYDNLNIKSISEMTTISRSSIYTYYKTKDEIILDLLARELTDWQSELIAMIEKKKKNDCSDLTRFCNEFVEILLRNDKMLQHYSLLYTFLEKNCRIEKLIDFKKSAVPVIRTLIQLIVTYFPNYSIEDATVIAEEIEFYVLGLYPATHLTQKQKKAITISETGYQSHDYVSLCRTGIEAFFKHSII